LPGGAVVDQKSVWFDHAPLEALELAFCPDQ